MKILREKKNKKKKNIKEASESEWTKILAKAEQQELKSKNNASSLIDAQSDKTSIQQLEIKKVFVSCKPMTNRRRPKIRTTRLEKTFGSYYKEK